MYQILEYINIFALLIIAEDEHIAAGWESVSSACACRFADVLAPSHGEQEG